MNLHGNARINPPHEFFLDIDYPVHPQYIIELIYKQYPVLSILDQCLTCAKDAYRSEKACDKGFEAILMFFKAGFNLYELDENKKLIMNKIIGERKDEKSGVLLTDQTLVDGVPWKNLKSQDKIW